MHLENNLLFYAPDESPYDKTLNPDDMPVLNDQVKLWSEAIAKSGDDQLSSRNIQASTDAPLEQLKFSTCASDNSASGAMGAQTGVDVYWS